ncbi:MAG: glycosyltransferase family 4 protein [Desulfamplus sp.]
MKILINASNLVMGGALQVARSLLIEIPKLEKKYTIKAVVSPQLAEILPPEYDYEVVSTSPAKIISGIYSRIQLSEIEIKFSPDIVLSIFGPTYWKPKNLHVCGFANPWIYTANDYAWKTRNKLNKILDILIIFLKRLELRRESADAYILETNYMVKALQKKFHRTPMYVISNNCGQPFYDKTNFKTDCLKMPEKTSREFRIITLTQYYPHKNLEIIPLIASKIKALNPLLNVKFYLPLAIQSQGWKKIYGIAKNHNVESYILTVGPVSPADAPQFYYNADLMLLSSVLECFSANYPEAMISGIPIITTDLPFARSVCKNAALYYKPMDALDAANKILTLERDKKLYNRLVESGFLMMKSFPTPREKAEMYMSICKKTFLSN